MTTNETPRPRRLLKWLRIGGTAAGLLVCLSTLALWKRSCHVLDWYERPIAENCTMRAISFGGSLQIGFDQLIRSTILFNDAWGLHSIRFDSPDVTHIGATPTAPGIGLRFTSIDNWNLWLPHWLLAVIGGACASLPWIRRRYSLRSLLAVMTLVAIVLGFMAALHQ